MIIPWKLSPLDTKKFMIRIFECIYTSAAYITTLGKSKQIFLLFVADGTNLIFIVVVNVQVRIMKNQ